MRDLNDATHVRLPPYYVEWFKLRYPNMPLPDGKVQLVIRLFNVCQGSVDAGMKWNQLLNKVMGKLGIHRSMRDLAVYSRKIDGAMGILNVSTDDILVYTDSPIIRTKVE